MNIKNLNEGFMRKYMKAVNEDFNPLEGLRSNIIEFPNGEYVYIGYENGKLFAGSATNTGIIHEFEIDYDGSVSADENIGELYDTIVENNPSYLDDGELEESYEDIVDELVAKGYKEIKGDSGSLRNKTRKGVNTQKNELKKLSETSADSVSKQLDRAKSSADEPKARDIALCIENDSRIYRRSVTPAIENLKKKVAKGSFDKTLAVQMFYNVVMNALNDKTFRTYSTYSVHDTDVPTRYLAAKYLLDYFSDDIGIDETITEKNLTRSERHNRALNRVFDQKKEFDKKVNEYYYDTEYLEGELASKTDSKAIKDAYERNNLTVIKRGNVFYFERCPSRIYNLVKREVKKFFPDLKWAYDESMTVKNESVEDVKKFLQPLVTDKGRVRALKNDEKLPRGIRFKSSNETSGEISFKGTDYAFAVVDGKLKVMTSADAGSNWSETLYKNESCKNVNEAKRGFIRKYKGCSLHDAGDKIVVTDEHGKNIGEERTESAAEGVIDSYIAKKTKATESLHEDVDVSDEDRIKALAEYLDVSADEISKTYGHEFETPDGDYLVCDENEARELAEEDINNSIDEMGIEAFSEDFQEWIKDNALDTGWFDSAMRESYESYVEGIESEGDSTYDNRLIQEMYDADILTDDDFVADGDDIDYTQLKEDVDIDSKKSDFVDYLCGQQGDPVEWYRDNFGEKELTDTIKSYDYILDRDAIVDECITWDGVSHFIATYDGDEIELGNNLYAYRTN